MTGRIFAVTTVIALALALFVSEARGAGPVVVDLNTATVEQLMAVPGIGPTRAQSIVRRRLVAPFRRPSDLLRIRGIGLKTYRKLRPYVRVATPLKELESRSGS